jgi:hypothetical protein
MNINSNIFKILAIFSISLILPQQAINAYHNYDQLEQTLTELASKYPQKSHLYSIGQSGQKRDIWVLAIANEHPTSHIDLRPEVKLVANIHGYALPTRELLLRFAQYLLENPDNSSEVEAILNQTRIHILPTLNPDGAEQALLNINCEFSTGRNNSNNIDLNRSFPDKFFCNDNDRYFLQNETIHALNWFDSTRFLLSGAFYTGGVVASFAYENFPYSENSLYGNFNPTDDNDVFRNLALKYTLNHKTMANEICDGKSYVDGVADESKGFQRNAYN